MVLESNEKRVKAVNHKRNVRFMLKNKEWEDQVRKNKETLKRTTLKKMDKTSQLAVNLRIMVTNIVTVSKLVHFLKR